MLNKAMILSVLLWTLVLLCPGMARAETGMTIAYPEFYPFFSKTGKGAVEGFFYEIITEALDHRMGIRTTWTEMPWKRCQEQVYSGRYDAMITVPTQERGIYCDTHPDPFYLKEIKVFTYLGHAGLARINALKTMADIKAGGFSVITYSGNGWHEKNISSLGIPTHETSLVPNVWKMLAARRGDLVIEWPTGAAANIRLAGVADKIIETGVSLESMPFHLLISKKSQFNPVLAGFNEVIKGMFNDGTMKRILSAYD
nr:amino acid ABC transporter substrate-binding protein [Desulfobacula sp.]